MTKEEMKNKQIFKLLTNMNMSERNVAISGYAPNIESDLDCKIVDRAYTELSNITGVALAVKDDFADLVYLKEFVPVEGDK